MAPLDLSSVQSQIRLTAFRLGQLRERHNQTSNITKRDVATLISQGEIVVARSKVEKLVRDDKLSDLLERLQFYCSQLLAKAAELGQPIDFELESLLLEAVCSVILVASRTELKDVTSLRDMLMGMYDQEFNQLAMKQYQRHVSLQVIDALDPRPPPAAQVDVYMASISDEFNLSWKPPLLPHQKSHLLAEILDQGAFPRMIDVQELRQICSRGIPLQPQWLRPRVWKLLLGTLSSQKDSWEVDAHSKRQSYYDLARIILSQLTSLPLPLPSSPLSPLDTALFSLAKSLSTLPQELDGIMEQSPLCPFDSSAPDGLRIEAADAVDERLRLIQDHVHGANSTTGIPESRLPFVETALQMPQISVSSPIDSPTADGPRKSSGTLLHDSVLTRSHSTSLLRILYIHMTLHPSTPTPYLTSILVPLYVAMMQEVEPAELAHVEPDTFWLLAELWGEVGELAEDEGSRIWVAKFGQRLAWADPELSGDLCRKRLDPALPHYSYRWLVPLLTRTLPSSSVLTIWDSLFAQPQRTSDHNAKLEFLVDICTSLLINARMKLFRLGRPAIKVPGLWGDVDVTVATPSRTPVEFEEGFTQGMALFQAYPIDELGGPERVIDTAIDLDNQRKHADRTGGIGFNLGERLRGTVWSSLMKRAPPAEPTIPETDNESGGTPSPQWPDSGAEDEGDVTGKSSALLGRLGNTVWRGITNQSAMDVPSSPLPPDSPIRPSSPIGSLAGTPLPHGTGVGGTSSGLGSSIWRGLTNQNAMEASPSPTEPTLPSPPLSQSNGFKSPITSGLWSYTGKLKDSDTAASLSKASTNWTARASILWRRSNPSSTTSSPEYPSHHSRTGSLSMPGKSWADMFPKRGSLPTHYDKEYSPPPRPNFRESRYFSPQERNAPDSPTGSVIGLSSPLLAKSKSALASLTGGTTATPKSGPRPLLLSSSSLITPSNPRPPNRLPPSVSRSAQPQDRISSASSASTPLSFSPYQSDRDSEGSSGRFVALRRGVSPHPSRSPRPGLARSAAEDSTGQSLSPEVESEPFRASFKSKVLRSHERRTSSEDSAVRLLRQIDIPDSPSTIPSSPPPKSPITASAGVNGELEEQHSSIASNVPDIDHFPQVEMRVGRKKSWNTTIGLPASSLKVTSDSSTSQENIPSVRSKRHGQRPTNLRLKRSDTDLGRSSTASIVDQRSNMDVTSLAPESFSDLTANTPRGPSFSSSTSPERPTRIRKNSRSPRPALRKPDLPDKGSFSSDGDDEGYDDFLSAYESEDGARHGAAAI